VIVPADQGRGPAAEVTAHSAAGAALGPLFYLLGAGSQIWLPYTLVSYTGSDLVYIALPGPPLHGSPHLPARQQAWAADLASRHRQHLGQLNNHRLWFRNLHPGVEIEHKFTLHSDSDIWRLATRTHRLLQAGNLPGWICEHGNNGGFEQWDFVNHLFEITEPPDERGYIAFIPAIHGTDWIIRRKRYPQDQPIRREDLINGIDLGPEPDLEQVIRDRFSVHPAWNGTYRRVRYNIMLESLITGHLYSIMYDRCTSPDVPPLVQAEAEYIHSRTLCGGKRDVVTELNRISATVRDFLHCEGITATEDNQSKLTWLRRHTGIS